MDDSHRPILGVAAVGMPADYDMLHRSFVRSLRAETAAPRTIQAYTLAVERLGEYLAGIDAELDVTDDLRREHIEASSTCTVLGTRREHPVMLRASREGEIFDDGVAPPRLRDAHACCRRAQDRSGR